MPGVIRAAAVAVALLALPYATVAAIDGASWWYYLPLAADLAALVAAAVWLWSPLAVLGGALLALACAVLYVFGVAAADTCGDSNLAEVVEWTGAAVIGVAVATWAVLGGTSSSGGFRSRGSQRRSG